MSTVNKNREDFIMPEKETASQKSPQEKLETKGAKIIALCAQNRITNKNLRTLRTDNGC